MAAAELDKDGIDRADLYAMAAADVAYIGCFYVVGSVGGNRQDGVEAFEEFSPVFGPENPCRSSCRINPVVYTGSVPSNASLSAVVSG